MNNGGNNQFGMWNWFLVFFAAMLIFGIIGGGGSFLGLLILMLFLGGGGYVLATQFDAFRRPGAFINFLHARNFLSQGKVQQALEHYDKALDMNPDFEIARREKAAVLMAIGSHSEAGDTLDQFGDEAARKIQVFRMKVTSLLTQGKWQEVIALCDEMIEQNPDYAGSYLSRAHAQQQIGHITEAMWDYEAFIERKPNHAPAYASLAQIYMAQGLLEKAEDAFSTAIERRPKFGASYAGRGYVRAMRGEIDTAYDDAETAIHYEPKNPGSYLARGYALALSSNYQDAFDDFQQALDLQPDYPFAVVGMAITHQLQGNRLQSGALWRTLVKREPRFAEPDHAVKFFGLRGDAAEAARSIAMDL
jgi:tetratricopeptide (TPR) repeat protein